MLRSLGGELARYLSKPRPGPAITLPTDTTLLRRTLQPGDVLLVEGRSRFSGAIKYLTQSSWSHAALYVGDALLSIHAAPDHCFVEADVVEGIRSVGMGEFDGLATRICRPVGLSAAELSGVLSYAIERIGHRYDLRNVIDLARYLLPTPPVPVRFRRQMIALGSGDPTRAICSTLIAQAFQSVRYPILPNVTIEPSQDAACLECTSEILQIRHHSLFTPRDFDLSPYFKVVKPTLEAGFDPHMLRWADMTPTLEGSGARQVQTTRGSTSECCNETLQDFEVLSGPTDASQQSTTDAGQSCAMQSRSMFIRPRPARKACLSR